MTLRREHPRVACTCGETLVRCYDPACLGCVPAVLPGCPDCGVTYGQIIKPADLLPLHGEQWHVTMEEAWREP